MPPTPDGQLKFNRDLPFLHTIKHSESGDEFSIPIVDYNHTQWTSADKIPQSLVEEIDTVIKGIYGPDAAKDLKPHTYRLCWLVNPTAIVSETRPIDNNVLTGTPQRRTKISLSPLTPAAPTYSLLLQDHGMDINIYRSLGNM